MELGAESAILKCDRRRGVDPRRPDGGGRRDEPRLTGVMSVQEERRLGSTVPLILIWRVFSRRNP
jgi:hypothetical protein